LKYEAELQTSGVQVGGAIFIGLSLLLGLKAWLKKRPKTAPCQ